jgi:enoyl-CoA hydratase/carnithine racemase
LPLTIERRGDVTLLTLANPGKANALDPALCGWIVDAVRALEGNARAAVLTGAGDKAFCSGFDLEALDQAEGPFTKLIDAVASSPVPIIAALNGQTFGGGCELAATCDLRVAHAGVKLGLPPAKLGIVYSASGLARFSAIVGESRARALFLAAKTIDASEAHRWGLVDEIVAPADLIPRAIEIAEGIAKLAPLAVQGMRRTFEALIARRAVLAGEAAKEIAERRAAAWQSEDVAEARRAFAEKRPPIFRGK